MTTPLLDAALAYARSGIPVFPCRRKQPLTPHGFKDASADESQIREWWNETPDAQVAAPTGAVTHRFAVDIDTPAAALFLEQLEAKHGELPATLHIATRPGRRQIHFSVPEGVRTKCTTDFRGVDGFDTRGDGGYVVLPPSIHHESGKPYRVLIDAPLAEVPMWLVEMLNERPASKNGNEAAGDKIPEGKRHAHLVSVAGALRRKGLSAEAIEAALIVENEEKCSPPYSAARVREIARDIASRYPPEAKNAAAQPDPNDWRGMFHSFEDFENAPLLGFAIANFLQLDAATMIGGLSGHGKTLIMLALAKALLHGPGRKLWGHFDVLERAERVLYLVPESAIGPFKHRLKLFGIYDSLRDDRLLVRTLSKGPTPCLSDPRILQAAKGAHVFLDTAIRFAVEGSENDASDNMRGLATDIFALVGAGARRLSAGAQHSPKCFAKETMMTLENVLRGSGDIGAMLATAWGIKQLEPNSNVIHIQSIKSRDFEPAGAFQLIGRPHIDNEGDFRMLKAPGECAPLAEEGPEVRGGGATANAREMKALKKAMLRGILEANPHATWEEIIAAFEREGVEIARGTIRAYRSEMGL